MVGLLPLLALGVLAAVAVAIWAGLRIARATRSRLPPGLVEIGALLAGLAVLSLFGTAVAQIIRSGLHSSRPGAQLLLEQALVLNVVVIGPAVALLLLRAHGVTGSSARTRRLLPWFAVGAIWSWLAVSLVLVGWSGAWPPLGWAVRHGQVEVARRLLQLGASHDARDRWTGRPLLATAVLRRDAAMARLLLAAGAEVDARDRAGDTPLVVACWQGDRGLVALLLDHGADPDVTDRGGQSPLMIAWTRDDPELARFLVGRLPRPPRPLEEALLETMVAGDREAGGEAFRRLIRRNVLTAAEWRRELLNAAREGRVDGVEEALAAGADVDGADEVGATPLLLACRAGSAPAVRGLLDEGARVDAADANGTTPLMAAAGSGSAEVILLLLDRGADPAAVDRNGWTARSLARSRGNTEAEALLAARGAPERAAEPVTDAGPVTVPREQLLVGRVEGDRLEMLLAISAGDVAAVERIFRTGTDLNGHDAATGGGTALTWAAYCNQPGVARRLLDLGAAVDGASDSGVTALMEAAKAGSASVAQVLLERGADPEARTRAGWTALLWASEGGHVEVVRLLLAHGASVESADPRGRTPLAIAREGDHDAVAELLVEAVARLPAG